MTINIEELNEIIVGNPEIIERDMNLIIEEIQRAGCTYATEIHRNTLVPKERAVQLMFRLLKEKKIFKLFLNPNYVPIELLPKMGHYWAIGIHGYDMFNSITWVIPRPQRPYSDYIKRYVEPPEDIKIEEIEDIKDIK